MALNSSLRSTRVARRAARQSRARTHPDEPSQHSPGGAYAINHSRCFIIVSIARLAHQADDNQVTAPPKTRDASPQPSGSWSPKFSSRSGLPRRVEDALPARHPARGDPGPPLFVTRYLSSTLRWAGAKIRYARRAAALRPAWGDPGPAFFVTKKGWSGGSPSGRARDWSWLSGEARNWGWPDGCGQALSPTENRPSSAGTGGFAIQTEPGAGPGGVDQSLCAMRSRLVAR